MKAGAKRIKLDTHEDGGKPVRYEFAVWCNVFKGKWIEHWHDNDGGHVFPIKRKDLVALYKSIGKLLDRS